MTGPIAAGETQPRSRMASTARRHADDAGAPPDTRHLAGLAIRASQAIRRAVSAAIGLLHDSLPPPVLGRRRCARQVRWPGYVEALSDGLGQAGRSRRRAGCLDQRVSPSLRGGCAFAWAAARREGVQRRQERGAALGRSSHPSTAVIP